MKLCNKCKRPVEFSVCALVSTNRLSPRIQRCSTSVPFCKNCLRSYLQSGDEGAETAIRQIVRPAFEQLAEQVKNAYGV
jgi:hypothetical protein